MNQVTTLLSISKIFKDRFFKIPDYQRGYSWELKQLKDLTEDILNLLNTQHKHYTGTIVASPVPKNNNYFDVVDGQQRITTVVILINEIINLYPSEFSYLEEIFIRRGEIGNKINVLTTNKETEYCFNEVIINSNSFEPEVKSHERILFAKKYFNEWIKKNQNNIKEIVEIIKNRLGFLFFTPKNDKTIGIMFEVINNRGKELSELEKIKNYFIYYATIKSFNSLRKTVNDKWEYIQRYLSKAKKTDNDQENNFIRNCYLVFFKANKEKSRNVYEELKKDFNVKEEDQNKVKQNVIDMENFVNFMAEVAKYYAFLFNQSFFIDNYKGADAHLIANTLKDIRCHPVNASIIPVYIAVMNRLEKSDRVAELLQIIEKLNFRLYVLPGIFRRADTRQGDMFFYANKFYHMNGWLSVNEKDEGLLFDRTNWEVEIHGNEFDWLKTQLVELTKRFCDEENFVEALTLDNGEEFDYYRNWYDGTKYLLACYEENLQEQNNLTFDLHRILIKRNDVGTKTNDYLSLEHIWAQANREKDFPSWHQQKRRIGNFVLMGLASNISLGYQDIPEKTKELIQYNSVGKGALNMHQVADLTQNLRKTLKLVNKQYDRRTKNYYRDLSIVINDFRETDIIKFALERWKMPDEDFNEFIKVDSNDNARDKNNYVFKD